jgi:hypothetical protein
MAKEQWQHLVPYASNVNSTYQNILLATVLLFILIGNHKKMKLLKVGSIHSVL